MIMTASELALKANQLRQQLLKMLHRAGSGHPGGSLSSIDIIATLYYSVMRIDPGKPGWEDRDRFILSKGHACPALYVVLADRGFFPKGELDHLRQIDVLLSQGSVDYKVPGVEMPGGSLGQGLSAGIGMALGARHLDKDFRVFVLMGDGETQEGQVWEAAMAASHFKLGGLTAFLDYNKLQGDGPVNETINLEPLAEKWMAFGWNVIEIDGHDFEQIKSTCEQAKSIKDRPTYVIAHTVKGKGVSFMENVASWHGSSVPNDEELEQALSELKQDQERLQREQVIIKV